MTDKTHALVRYMALYEPNTAVIEAAKALHVARHGDFASEEYMDAATAFDSAVEELLDTEGEG